MKQKRTCSQCHQEKPLHLFGRNRSRKDGLDVRCKECRSAYYQANRDAIITRTRNWQVANADRDAANRQSYRENNLDKIKQREKEYRAEHREQETNRVRRWRNRKRLAEQLAQIAAEVIVDVLTQRSVTK